MSYTSINLRHDVGRFLTASFYMRIGVGFELLITVVAMNSNFLAISPLSFYKSNDVLQERIASFCRVEKETKIYYSAKAGYNVL
jgi:hypothetical protein